jgi:hypothetical protein
MNYPLQLRFKIFGFAPQIFINDSDGTSVFYVKQKLFKLKEAVKVFKDSSQTLLCYQMKADRIIDFSAKYHFSTADGSHFGAVGRQGMRSLFRVSYDVYDGDAVCMNISEESVIKRLMENLFGSIPLLGFFVVMLLNPSYIVKDAGGDALFRLTKLPSFFEAKFSIDKLKDLPADDETRALLSLMMLTLLERSRG